MRAAIVLAAGASRRFGRADKLFAVLRGEALLVHALRAACAAPASRVIVVASRPHRVRALVCRAGLRGVTVVRGGRRGAPLSDTLRAGVAALRPIERDAFVFLGDMPNVPDDVPARLARAGRGPAGLIRPRCRGVPGHPVLACRVHALPLGHGDRGFRVDPAAMVWIRGTADCIVDVDRQPDLRRLRRRRAVPRRC